MGIDFSSFFRKYEEISRAADSVFDRVKKDYPDDVTCKIECSDCCHALFDISLIEALYINHHFNKAFVGAERDRLIEQANRADRQVYKLKRNIHRELGHGRSEIEILNEMAGKKIRCSLLNEKDRCDLYAYRPITCRLYGIPTSIHGKGYTCGLSGFTKGQSYQTVKLDAIHRRLFEISTELVQAINSRYAKLADLLVPISMALLTDYDEAYLGIATEDRSETDAKGEEHD